MLKYEKLNEKMKRSGFGVIFVSPPEWSDFFSANRYVLYRTGAA